MGHRLFLLGHPVGHSKSPVMHNAAYQALGLPWEYALADCPTEEDARAFLADPCWLGMNVTMPYKRLAYETATWRSDAAVLAQGANVLVRCDGDLRADNTDGIGCISYLKRKGVPFSDARVVVCGTGPTSIALMHAAAQAGARQVMLLGRDGPKARKALAGFQGQCSSAMVSLDVDLSSGCYAEAADAIAHADVILDATPLGMKPGDPAPFDVSLLGAGQTVFDVVYGHGETALVAAARKAGCSVYDGSGMLVAQAVETVNDLISWLGIASEMEQGSGSRSALGADSVDLFSVMAQAAGFSGL